MSSCDFFPHARECLACTTLPHACAQCAACLRDEPAFCAGAERLRRALMLGFANRLARRMPQHNGYKTLGAGATLAQLHPATARIAADDSGLLPEWLIYHELVATARTFLSKARFSAKAQRGIAMQ